MRVDSDQIQEGPPWYPEVWVVGPDALIARDEQKLWHDQKEIDMTLAGTDRSMSGSGHGLQNESDQMISVGPAGDAYRDSTSAPMSRQAAWHVGLREMYRTNPLAAWANGAKDGPPNPSP